MNRTYFTLNFASATKETGTEYPQVQEMGQKYDYDAPNSIDALIRFRSKLPDFTPNLDYFILHNRANPTDILSTAPISGVGLLISEKFKSLLEDFHLPKHTFYEARVLHRGFFIEGYYWFHFISDYTNYVDYAKSDFFLYKNYSKDLGSIEVKSKEDFSKKEKDIENDVSLAIWSRKITLTNDFDHNLDLFKVSKFNSDVFISEKLSQSIKGNKLTGFVIKSTDILSI